MRNNPILTSLLFLFFVLNGIAIHAQYHSNLDFEDNTLTDSWKYSNSDGYKIYIDSTDAYCGKRSLVIENKLDITQSFGSISNTMPIDIGRGTKVKFKCMIMTATVAVETALFITIHDEKNKSLGYNNSVLFMKKSIKGNSDWTEIETELEVGSGGAYVGFGVYLAGLGKVNIDCFEIYIDGKKVE